MPCTHRLFLRLEFGWFTITETPILGGEEGGLKSCLLWIFAADVGLKNVQYFSLTVYPTHYAAAHT